MSTLSCPCCGSAEVETFFEALRVPVNSVLMLKSKAEALDFPRGDIVLGRCASCGFIYNTTFKPKLLEYSERYDPTQAFSETFNTWHRKLASDLIEKYELRGKRVLEIGCGKGEFLCMLCEQGENSGIGFDPAYTEGRNSPAATERIEFVKAFYSEKYAHYSADFVICKMTLEHISDVRQFLTSVRRAIGDDRSQVFFQVPDVQRILEEKAFWDIYYEHCCYFSMGSLARVFRRVGFDVLDLAREYSNQYLMIEARPSEGEPSQPLPQEADLETLAQLTTAFRDEFEKLRAKWSERIAAFRATGKRVCIWGSGSKGVAFLTTMQLSDDIEYVVDINPHRQGHYMLGTGHRIVGPQDLPGTPPDVVIVMNPVYRDEIARQLNSLGLRPELLTT
jgi:ubiquinone/menaquinone biosynthesis C-methylase UbiE